MTGHKAVDWVLVALAAVLVLFQLEDVFAQGSSTFDRVTSGLLIVVLLGLIVRELLRRRNKAIE